MVTHTNNQSFTNFGCWYATHKSMQHTNKGVMAKSKPIPPDFLFILEMKDGKLIELFTDLREYILDIYADSNELLYHTHALTSLFSVSDKLSDAFCMINIYSNHLNLGFNKGTLLNDPYTLLSGTGNLIRHIPIKIPTDYRNKNVRALIDAAANFAIKDMDKPTKLKGMTISKISKK